MPFIINLSREPNKLMYHVAFLEEEGKASWTSFQSKKQFEKMLRGGSIGRKVLEHNGKKIEGLTMAETTQAVREHNQSVPFTM